MHIHTDAPSCVLFLANVLSFLISPRCPAGFFCSTFCQPVHLQTLLSMIYPHEALSAAAQRTSQTSEHDGDSRVASARLLQCRIGGCVARRQLDLITCCCCRRCLKVYSLTSLLSAPCFYVLTYSFAIFFLTSVLVETERNQHYLCCVVFVLNLACFAAQVG